MGQMGWPCHQLPTVPVPMSVGVPCLDFVRRGGARRPEDHASGTLLGLEPK